MGHGKTDRGSSSGSDVAPTDSKHAKDDTPAPGAVNLHVEVLEKCALSPMLAPALSPRR